MLPRPAIQKIQPEDIPYAKFSYTIKSKKSGIVSGISNRDIVDICWTAGTPKDRYAGIMLNKKIEDHVKKSEPLFTVYAENKHKLKKAKELAKNSEIFTILDKKKNKMLIKKI